MFDDNLLQDASKTGNNTVPQSIALALTNALFKVTQPNGALLFGSLSEDYAKVESGFLFFTFGLFAYLPTLPDPYAANLGVLRRQVRGREFVRSASSAVATSAVTAWLVCRVWWQPPAADGGADGVEVSFHFAPLSNQFGGISLEEQESQAESPTNVASPASPSGASNEAGTSQRAAAVPTSGLTSQISNAIAVHNVNVAGASAASLQAPYETRASVAASSRKVPLPNYEELWDAATSRIRQNIFALLDVSTNADLYGVSFNWLAGGINSSSRTSPWHRAVLRFPCKSMAWTSSVKGATSRSSPFP